MESALSLAPAEDGVTPSHSSDNLAAAAAEGPLLPQEQRQAALTALQPGGASPSRPARPASRLRRCSIGAASAASSCEGSQHGAALASGALAAAARRQAEQVAADAGVQATAARLLVATIEEAAAALPELEAPGTPTPGEDGEEGPSPGPSGAAAAAAAGGPHAALGFSRVALVASRAGSARASRTVSPEPAAANSAPAPPPFESGGAAWADLALLGGIAAAGQELKLGLDVFEY